MSLESDTLFILKERSKLRSQVRSFFHEKGVLEVDCPAITKKPSLDLHIEVMEVEVAPNEIGYLHTSPEYAMKRLLAEGVKDIYQLSHVFRKSESGYLHNPEFTMIEWYRYGLSYREFIAETIALIELFLPKMNCIFASYEKTFLTHTPIHPYLSSKEELLLFCKNKHFPEDIHTWDRDTLLQLILTHFIEPYLGKDSLYIITDFPSSQAALSQTNGQTAQRFEIYHKGIELANGYHELTDPVEQKKRFLKIQTERKEQNKPFYPLDDEFLLALEKGIGDCMGVAVGFDRLLLLRLQKDSIKKVIPFSW